MFKIEFIKPPAVVMGDATTFLLCESSRSLAEYNFRLNGQLLFQEAQFLRADYAEQFARGNARNVVTFEVARSVDFAGEQFADAESAGLFALDAQRLLPGVGVLKLTLEGTAGSAERWLANAAMQPPALTAWAGVLLTHAFTVNGGAFSEEDPR